MKTTITTFALLLTFYLVKAQTVSTVTGGLFSDGLGIDSEGNIYGSDYAGDSVFKYDLNSGIVTTFKSGFSNPNGIGVNPQDQIYICDHTGGTIYKYDLSGIELDSYSGIVTPAGIKNIPGTNDMMFVTYNTNTINVLSNDGTITSLYSGAPINGPAGVAFVDGIAYIGNFNDRRIYKYESGDVTFIAQLPASAAQNNFLGFLTAKDGYLLATQIGENKLYKIDPNTGEVVLVAGSTQGNMDGPLNEATFNAPNGVLADEGNNRIYVSDANTRNLRIIDGINLSTQEILISNFEMKLLNHQLKDQLEVTGNFLTGTTYLLKVFDIQGKLHVEKRFSVNSTQHNVKLSTANWAKGVYVVELSDGRNSISKKFVK